MKKLLWIPAFLALTFLGDRMGGFLLQQVAENSQFRYSRLYRTAAKSDILLVGNSRGLMFYQPYIEEATGESTFNLSYNGMPIALARVLVEDYLEKHEAPKVMVLDITMCDRSNAQLISSFNMYSSYSPRLQALLRDSVAKSYYAGQLSHLYRYNSEVFQRALFYLKKSDEDWLLDRVITDDLVQNVGTSDTVKWRIEPNMMRDLKATVEAAQAKGVTVKLVINPYFPPYADKITNLAELKAAAEKATGLEVHDYAKAVADVSGFGDYQHLNKVGSIQYLDKLLADSIFP